MSVSENRRCVIQVAVSSSMRVLCVKSGLFPVQWQCRFRTSVRMFFLFKQILFMFYLYLWITKLLRMWVEFQLVIQ